MLARASKSGKADRGIIKLAFDRFQGSAWKNVSEQDGAGGVKIASLFASGMDRYFGQLLWGDLPKMSLSLYLSSYLSSSLTGYITRCLSPTPILWVVVVAYSVGLSMSIKCTLDLPMPLNMDTIGRVDYVDAIR